MQEQNFEKAHETDPSLEEIAVHECGCRCGAKGCEFAADFFNAQGEPTAEFGQDEDLLQEAEFSVKPVENAYGRAAVEEYADEWLRQGEFAENAVTEAEADAEFGDEVHLTGDMSVNEGPVTDDIRYRNTADYRMIDPDGESFNTMGS